MSKIRRVLITPELAEMLLRFNTANRRESPFNEHMIRVSMDEGLFRDNGQTNIIVAGTLHSPIELLNGQTTLQALIMHGEPVELWIAEHVDPDTWSTMDSGRSRTFAHDLQRLKVPNADKVATVVRLLYLWIEADPRQRVKVDRQHLLRFFHEQGGVDSGVSTSVRVARRISKDIRGCSSAVAAAHYRCARTDAPDADGFFSALETGADLTKVSPILQLRSLLQGFGKHPGFIEQDVVLGHVVTAWNLWREGAVVRTLRYKGDRLSPFPEPK